MFYDVALADGRAEFDEDLMNSSSKNQIIPNAYKASQMFKANKWQKEIILAITVANANEQNYAILPEDSTSEQIMLLKQLGYEVDMKMDMFFWPKH